MLTLTDYVKFSEGSRIYGMGVIYYKRGEILMKNYVSPVIFDNEELAEGVYATGSGGGAGCWKVTDFKFEQDRREGFPERHFRIYATHLSRHISTMCTFTGPVTGTGFDGTVSLRANSADWTCTINANEYTVSRVNHGNSELSLETADVELYLTLPWTADLKLGWPTPTYCDKKPGINSGMDS